MALLVLAAVREELGELEGEMVGIGPVEAAARSAALLETRRPSHVVLLGSAGAYAGGPAVGTAVASRQLGLSWGVAALGLGYVPGAPPTLRGDPEMLSRVDVPAHDVLTVGAITTDPDLAARLSDGWTVEHMEAYAVAVACHHARIPFLAVLGIANDVGPDAHVQWLTHRDEAQSAARRAVRTLMT